MKGRIVLAILLSAVTATSLAPAQAQEYSYFEAYGGYYDPGFDELDNDVTLGLRFGGRVTPVFGWSFRAAFSTSTATPTARSRA